MKQLAMTAALMLAALGAHAEMPQILGSDPLSRQILTKTAQPNGGVTAAVRLESGQSVELKLADVTALAPATVKLAPAATEAYLKLSPAEGLAAKAAKAKPKKEKAAKRAVDQLKRIAAKTSTAKF
ncbi:MAG TPA: hypothetical protein VN915_04925 [Elusimicrobiota bacterium]|nr:hypothetical protein [Elusimicrobiota bacterium]